LGITDGSVGDITLDISSSGHIYVACTETGHGVVYVWDDFTMVCEEGDETFPTSISLTAYPNPFNSSCKIDGAPEGAVVDIFDTYGRRVDRVVGNVWQPRWASTGTYFARVITDSGMVGIKKLTYVK
jgi:hypothetical protein